MNIRIGHCKQGILFSGDVAKLEIIEQDNKIRYILHDWDGTERDILAENQYTVLRIGNKKDSSRPNGWLSSDGKPTTYDLEARFDEAVKTLKEAGVDTERISFYLPNKNGWLQPYGPMPAEEARTICMEYWEHYSKTEA